MDWTPGTADLHGRADESPKTMSNRPGKQPAPFDLICIGAAGSLGALATLNPSGFCASTRCIEAYVSANLLDVSRFD